MLRKKSLGQNFLTSAHYLALIADSADIQKGEAVLEVGPGDGALTAQLLARGAKVIAVEKDHRLIPILTEKFAQEIAEERLTIVEGDILQFDVSNYQIKGGSYKVVANIPYYITGALLRKFLSEGQQPSLLVLLVQKEVAERIARSKKESILSLSVKAYGHPAYIKTLPSGAFSPPPKIDSAILKIDRISRKNFASADEEKKFFELLHAGFGQKRKLLKRNLQNTFGEVFSDMLQHVGISQKARAEDVALEKWLQLVKQS